MPTNVTWNGTSYSIPNAGELNWASLTTFLVALGNNAAVAQEMKQAIRVATTTPVTVASATDFAIVVDLAVAGASVVNLPAGVNGQVYVVVDGKGDAFTNNITVNPNGAETIGGGSSVIMNKNRQSLILQYHAATTDWKVLEYAMPVGQVSSGDIVGTIAPSKGGTGVANNDAATLTRSGNHALTLTTTNTTNVTLPTTGTLATLAGTEVLTNKDLSDPSNDLSTATSSGFTNSGNLVSLPAVVTTLVGRDTTDTLTNKDLTDATNDLSGATATNLVNGGNTVTFPAATTTLVGRDTTDVLTNKDIDGGTASNTHRITLPKASSATLAGLTRKQGTVVYDTTSNLVNYDDGSTLIPLAASAVLQPTTGPDADTTLTEADGRLQQVTPTTERVYTLDPTTFTAGDYFQICNLVAGGTTTNVRIRVEAGDATVIGYVYANGSVKFYAKSANPSTSTDWRMERFDDENWYTFSTAAAMMGATDVSADFTYDVYRWKRKENHVWVKFYGHWVNANVASGDFNAGVPINIRAGSAALGVNYRAPLQGYWQSGSNLYPVIINYAGSASQARTAFSSLRRNGDPTYYGVGDGNLSASQWGNAGDVINCEFDYESEGA